MYFSPFIDSTGLHIPLYSDILSYLIASFKSTYGQDVYLGNDAADYQFLSVLAKMLNDGNLVLQQDYNNRSPFTAVGTALDSLVKDNGMSRKEATYSTCIVDVVGIAGTEIDNGVVSDLSGNNWDLPAIVIIGSNGTISVSATCETIGAILAQPNSITKIVTPQLGWTSVNNSAAAVPGQPIETDAQLRSRQALSTRLASHTMLSGTIAGIAAVQNVTRYNVHENNTNLPDAEVTPPHSITAIVEGGTDLDVATAIFQNRGIGCTTNGSSNATVVDPDTGESMTIYFSRPSYVPIYVDMVVKKLSGYTDSITDQINEAIYNYLNELQIGQSLTISALYGAALAVMPSLIEPLFSITTLEAGEADVSPLGTVDITLDFDQVTQGILGTSPEYIRVVVE